MNVPKEITPPSIDEQLHWAEQRRVNATRMYGGTDPTTIMWKAVISSLDAVRISSYTMAKL